MELRKTHTGHKTNFFLLVFCFFKPTTLPTSHTISMHTFVNKEGDRERGGRVRRFVFFVGSTKECTKVTLYFCVKISNRQSTQTGPTTRRRKETKGTLHEK